MIPSEISFKKQQEILPSPVSTFPLYGLHITSNRLLPLPAIHGEKPADISIYFEGIIDPLPGSPPKTVVREWRQEKGHWLLRFYNIEGHILEFLLNQDGKEIRIRQSFPEWQDTIFVLLNTALAGALHLQGRTMLHASVLVKNDKSYAFSGKSGSGKSSFASALVAEGLALQSDDIGAFTMENHHPIFHAGYPYLKISSPIAEILGWQKNQLKTIFSTQPDYEEKWLDLSSQTGGFYRGSAPLKAIYILCGRKQKIQFPHIETLSAGQGAFALVHHFYGHPWLVKPGKKTLSLCAHLAGTIPIHRVWLPDGLEHLRGSAQAFLQQSEQLG